LGSLLSYPHPPRGTNDPAVRRVFKIKETIII
jgi:hypothetical protein